MQVNYFNLFQYPRYATLNIDINLIQNLTRFTIVPEVIKILLMTSLISYCTGIEILKLLKIKGCSNFPYPFNFVGPFLYTVRIVYSVKILVF